LLKIARVTFRNDPQAATALGLSGIRKQSFSGWLDQVQQFYLAALAKETYQSKFAQFGVTLEKLQTGKDQLDEVVAASGTKENETGEAQQATQTRDAAFDALDTWMSDFFAIARIALDGTQLSEALGLLERA